MLFDHQLASVRTGTGHAVCSESPAPHPVIRRYAALASSMMLLTSKFEVDEQGEARAAASMRVADLLKMAHC